MENYYALFTMLSLPNLTTIYKKVLQNNVLPNDREMMERELLEWTEENGDYNIKDLDDIIIDVLQLKYKYWYSGFNRDWGTKTRLHSPYNELELPNKWNVELIINGQFFNTEFTQGAAYRMFNGNRYIVPYNDSVLKRLSESHKKEAKQNKKECGIPYFTVSFFNTKLYYIDFIHKYTQPAPPSLLTVLDCLLMDCSCVGFGEYTVDDFCNEFGYDVDSIKSNEIYKQCMKTSRELKRLL